MNDRFRIGTRRSALARAQTDLVLARLRAADPSLEVTVVPIATAGDATARASGPLDFTDALDAAVERGEVDWAVHSAKDLPAVLRPTVRIVAVPRRADPRDGLVLRAPGTWRTLPAGARIGSTSVRRQAQLQRARPDLKVVALRGNVDTRLERVHSGAVDGAILAVAGLQRLGRGSEVHEVLDVRRFLPAPGQGALAVTARADDARARQLGRVLDHAASRAAVTAERTFSATIGGDCTLPLAALGTVRGRRLLLRAEILPPGGAPGWSGRLAGSPDDARRLGTRLGRTALRTPVGAWARSHGGA